MRRGSRDLLGRDALQRARGRDRRERLRGLQDLEKDGERVENTTYIECRIHFVRLL